MGLSNIASYDSWKLASPDLAASEVYDIERAYRSVTDEMVGEWLEDNELEHTPDNVATAEKSIVDDLLAEWWGND